MSLPIVAAGAVFGCHDHHVELGYRVVIDVLGQTTELLSVPEYAVRIYDRDTPSGRDAAMPLPAFSELYVQPLTADERGERLGCLQRP